jgi:ribosomal RNA methyltransferase Nop2
MRSLITSEQRGTKQEFDFDSDSEDVVLDDFDGGVDSDTDSVANSDEGPVTAANIEARSRTLDAKAKRDAALDLGINQADDDAMDEDGEGGDDHDIVTFDLPTAEEREEEKKRGGGDLHEVQRRIQDCVRVLSDFKMLAAKDRSARTINCPLYQPHSSP